jgi:hypothetical protein
MNSAVSREDFLRELNKVLDATSFRLPRHPQFKVARIVVGLNPIPMMDRFPSREFSPQLSFHNDSVLQDSLAFAIDTFVDVAVGIDVRLSRAW